MTWLHEAKGLSLGEAWSRESREEAPATVPVGADGSLAWG